MAMPSPCEKHPRSCATLDEDGLVVCGWCQEVAPLKEQIKALTDQLHKTAVLVAGGEVNIYGDIGYAVVYQGTINMRTPDLTLTPRQMDPLLTTIAEKLSPPKKLPSRD